MIKSLFVFLMISISSFSVLAQNYLDSLTTISDFNKLSGRPLSNKYGQINAVKVVLDLKSGRIFYLNADVYKYHHEFCSAVLGNDTYLSYFNKYNYSTNPKRKFLLGNLNFIKTTNTYFLELSPTDQMPLHLINQFFSKVKASTYLDQNLQFIINSNRLQLQADSLQQTIATINTSDLYKGLTYQAISKSENDGVFRIVNNLQKELNLLKPTDIILLNETPIFLPQVAGIIVTEFQTPLSHLAILGQNRHIPIMAYTHAFTDSMLTQLNGKPVNLNVNSDTFSLKAIPKIDTKSHNPKEIKLKFNLEVDTLIPIQNLSKKSYKYIGNKANNFATLFRLSKNANFKTPESAFAIPFFFYHQHTSKKAIQAQIDQLLLIKNNDVSNDSIKVLLKGIRTEILNTPINKKLLLDIEKMISQLGDYTRFRFRSSTNAEDASGFSGAGIYTSKTGILNSSNKPIDVAIKKVWASLWNYSAFMEREYYHINHSHAFMGILAHRSFPNEEVNGVAITKNLYRDNSYGFVVNTQLGNENVVKPKSGVICDQIICYPATLNNMYDENNTIEIITVSSLSIGNLLMKPDEILNLANQLEKIKKHFYYSPYKGGEYIDFAMDIEFKLDGESRQLYIKQARIFND